VKSSDVTERMSAADFRAQLDAKRKGAQPRRQPEFDEQVLFFILLDHLADAYPDRIDDLRDIWASANGGLRSTRAAGRLLASGVRRGVPDIEVMVPANGQHGLFIEMKAPGSGRVSPGRVSPNQRQRIERLTGRGYRAVVAYGWVDAGHALCDYLGLAWQPRWLVEVPAAKSSRRGKDWKTGRLLQ